MGVEEVERRLGGFKAVGQQACEEVDHEVGGTAVARVLNLGDVLELVDDGLNERTLAQQQLVPIVHQTVLHVGADAGHQMQVLLPKAGEKFPRNVALVPEELAPQ